MARRVMNKCQAFIKQQIGGQPTIHRVRLRSENLSASAPFSQVNQTSESPIASTRNKQQTDDRYKLLNEMEQEWRQEGKLDDELLQGTC